MRTLPEGCIITIDAAGTQRANASLIRAMNTDYVLALKGNHPNLRDEVENYFLQAKEAGQEYAPLNEFVTEEKGHGRLEYRRVSSTDDLDWLEQKTPCNCFLCLQFRFRRHCSIFRTNSRNTLSGFSAPHFNQYREKRI